MVAESWRGGRYLLLTQELCSQDRLARFGELERKDLRRSGEYRHAAGCSIARPAQLSG